MKHYLFFFLHLQADFSFSLLFSPDLALYRCHVPRGFGDIPISFLPCPWFTVALLLFYCIMFGSFFGIPCLNTTMDDTSSWATPAFPFNRGSLA